MRELTIHRRKTFVGSLGTLKVYVEDPAASELSINGVPCRKLGTLTNGEQKTFPIVDSEVKIFVIADKLSKNFCNEYATIPAGTEPVCLSGKCHLSPFAGNPFRFDGEVSADVLANRQTNTRKTLPIMIISIALGIAVGIAAVRIPLALQKNRPKDFAAEGLQITLTHAFQPTPNEGMTVCYGKEDVAVLALKEPFTLMDGFADRTLEDYFAMIRQSNAMDSSIALQHSGNISFFEYRSSVNEEGDEFYYLCALYKGPDAFWMIHFATPAENANKYRGDFLVYAASVTFE